MIHSILDKESFNIHISSLFSGVVSILSTALLASSSSANRLSKSISSSSSSVVWEAAICSSSLSLVEVLSSLDSVFSFDCSSSSSISKAISLLEVVVESSSSQNKISSSLGINYVLVNNKLLLFR